MASILYGENALYVKILSKENKELIEKTNKLKEKGKVKLDEFSFIGTRHPGAAVNQLFDF